MDPEQFQIMMEMMAKQTGILEEIRDALIQPQGEPNYQKSLDAFLDFDWSSIGAIVEGRDSDGVAAVIWKGSRYIRRSASNKFKPAIWFSKSAGKDEKGETKYERLITFRKLPRPEPLPDKVRQ
jgi:hypothetical protein